MEFNINLGKVRDILVLPIFWVMCVFSWIAAIPRKVMGLFPGGGSFQEFCTEYDLRPKVIVYTAAILLFYVVEVILVRIFIMESIGFAFMLLFFIDVLIVMVVGCLYYFLCEMIAKD